MQSTDELLELEVPLRFEGLRFDLLDADLTVAGTLSPDDSRPTITYDSHSSIMRTLRGLRLMPSDTAAIDFRNQRVQPRWKLANGATFPLGVYAFSSPIQGRHSWGVESVSDLQDLGVSLESETDQATSFPRSMRIGDAMTAFLSEFLATPFTVSDTGVRIGQAPAWAPGTRRSEILRGLAEIGGYLPPYFDNAGRLWCVPAPDVDAASSGPFDYRPGTNVEADTIAEADDELVAFNRYIVLGGSRNNGDPIVGVYDVPDSARQSIVNSGGIVRSTTITLQSVRSDFDARQAARAAYVRDTVGENVEFDAVADPRHDVFDVVSYLGNNYLSIGWTLDLTHGGRHHHVIRRVRTT